MRPVRELTRAVSKGWLGAAVGLILWEVVPRSGLVPEQYIPPASVVIPELFTLLGDGSFWLDVRGTLSAWAVGMAISICLAIPAGLVIGMNEYLYRATRAAIEFFRPIPSVALIPLAILVYGITFDMKVFLVTFATFWPLLIQSIYGVQDVDPVARDTARSFGLGRVTVFFKVILPSAAPYIATGLRLASALAIILAITAELVAGVPGLGRSILLAQSAGANTLMYALIFATGLLSYGLSAILRRLERYVLRWHQSHRESQSA
jgi:ABC-type nitrate/sulfonate/bicarbonate transport system permease component